MSVVVQFRVRVPDVERFKKAVEEMRSLSQEDGERNGATYQAENDPNEVMMVGEWDSHDAMHESSEKRGDEFNEKAGTEGLDWETRVWHRLAGADTLMPVDASKVLVQFRVRVPDVDRFKKAWEELDPAAQQDGAGQSALFHAENDPSELGMFTEWASHDAMHESSEKRGDEFQEMAGTQGLDWETRIWHRLA